MSHRTRRIESDSCCCCASEHGHSLDVRNISIDKLRTKQVTVMGNRRSKTKIRIFRLFLDQYKQMDAIASELVYTEYPLHIEAEGKVTSVKNN